MVGCAVGGAADEGFAGREDAGDGVDGGDFQGFLSGEGREDAGDSFGQHGLSGAGWAGEEQVVAAGGGDLQGEAGSVLACDVGEVGSFGGVGGESGAEAGAGDEESGEHGVGSALFGGFFVGDGFVGEDGDQLAEAADAEDGDAGDE